MLVYTLRFLLFYTKQNEQKTSKMPEKYSNPLLHTSQFTMCGNCFRMDSYKGCWFGCEYCFANARAGGGSENNFNRDFAITDPELVRKWFYEAIELGETNNIKKEMLNHRVPIHLGGMSDPFQELEKRYRVTYRLLEISKKYKYPINISTKTSSLEEMYFELLDPKIHTFSISLIGVSDDYIRTWETRTPLASERINFIKELKKRGFWVSIRIQPIIDIKEVVELVKETDDLVDYYTIEHLKIPTDNKQVSKAIFKKLSEMNLNIKLVPKGREYEFEGKVKLENINKIKELAKTPVGCGDNDFHVLSESLNCCGIDLMPKSFSNWMKYNTMYIKMTGDKSQWFPQNNCNACFVSHCIKKGFTTIKQYTDRAFIEQYGSPNQLALDFG